MTETKTAEKQSKGEVARTSQARPTAVYVPNVDICEDSEQVHLIADIPGVSQGSVNVTVENNVLTVNAQAEANVPEGYALIDQEFAPGAYRRSFNLSDAVDVDGIKARVHQGVLELVIPKREEVKTRKIEITS